VTPPREPARTKLAGARPAPAPANGKRATKHDDQDWKEF
jgi:hypothetical protein